MFLTSWPFVAFVAVTFALYYLPLLQRWQVQILVLASLCFYGTLQPEMLALLVVAVIGTWFFLRWRSSGAMSGLLSVPTADAGGA